MDEEVAVGEEDQTQAKIYYLIGILAVYVLMFFFYVGATAADQKVIIFYMLFGLLLGLLPFLFDFIVQGSHDLPLDTISYENNSPIPFLNNPTIQHALS